MSSSSHRHTTDDSSRRAQSSRHKRSREYDEQDHRSSRHHASSSSRRLDDDRHRHHSSSSSRKRETSTERRERKAARKAEKLQQLADSYHYDENDDDQGAAQRTQVADLLMYSAQDNPFNDPTLDQKFTWAKKQDKERKMGLSHHEAEQRDAQRRREALLEIEKLNAKRAEREKQALLREQEESRMARLAESAQMASWVAKEDDFHLEQAKRRAVIRVKENRAKPIDLLSINLRWADPALVANPTHDSHKHLHQNDDDDNLDDEAGLEIDFDEPYDIFTDLSLLETQELHQDIQMYLSLESNEANLEFWRSMLIVCDDKLDTLDGADSADTDEQSRIQDMLSDKSLDQLTQLQQQVRAKLASDEPMDVEYWERVLKSIVVWRARAKLKDLHEVVLLNRIEYLRRKQREQATEAASTAVADDRPNLSGSLRGELSKLVSARHKALGTTAATPTTVAAPNAVEQDEDADAAAERLFMQEASRALDMEEEVFTGDEVLSHQTYQWQDKYRPRKPRYFNRVHTGFEWNKYNQTHYDSDNPPPKTVQGYKFNLFYPDLIDKTVAPSYKIVKEAGSDDTALLHFSAGPPYEDIAFRIVHRDWEYGHKHGFRNSFDRGVLQLHFNFKRLRYRK